MRRPLIACAALSGVLLVAGCGPEIQPPGSDPHNGWVRVDDYTHYRCVGVDKVIKTEGHGNMQQDIVKDSADCG